MKRIHLNLDVRTPRMQSDTAVVMDKRTGDIETALPSGMTFNVAALPLIFRYIDGTELRQNEVDFIPTAFLRNYDNNVSKQRANNAKDTMTARICVFFPRNFLLLFSESEGEIDPC
jgi:hypothetical protein